MRMETRDSAGHGSGFKAFPLPPRAGLRDVLCPPNTKFLPNKTSSFACPAGNASCALNYSQEVPCPETYRTAGEPQGFGCSTNGQWRGLVPTPSSALPKPRLSRGSYLDARKNPSGTSNSFVGKSNHHCHGSAFPIKPAQSPSWSGPCRRSLLSPKKTPRRFISTAEETVREEEREIYRQLLQMVTGKQFSTSKPSSLFPFHLSRCSNSSKTILKETPSKNSKLFEAHSIAPASSATSVLGTQEQPSHKPPLYSTPSYPSNIFESHNSTAQHQQENLPASNTQSEGSDSVILLKVKDSRTPAPSLPFFQAELWIKELTSVYDSRARERWRQIEEQKALALQLQSQRLQEQEHSVQDLVDLNLRVPLEKEIPVTVVPEKKEGAKSADGEEEFPEITEEMEKEIKNVFRGGNQDEVLSEAFRLTITRKDIQTLNNLNWLNDEIINFYMNLLMERSKEKGLPTVHAFNTFFFTKLKTAGYQAVKRWTKKVDIFSVDLLLVPIHLGVHWCLAVVDFRKKTITYYDSMGGINSEACRILLKSLSEAAVPCAGINRFQTCSVKGIKHCQSSWHHLQGETDVSDPEDQGSCSCWKKWHLLAIPQELLKKHGGAVEHGRVLDQNVDEGGFYWLNAVGGSLREEGTEVLFMYLKQESLDKKRKEFDTNGWSLLSKKSQEIPQQMNGSDCGMFACKYADCITKDKPINFTQQHMPYFRKRMAWEILHRKLL